MCNVKKKNEIHKQNVIKLCSGGQNMLTNHSFNIGQFVVCPGHGVGQICDVEEKSHQSGPKRFYIIRVVANGLIIMVPENGKGNIMRGLVTKQEVQEIYIMLKEHDIEIDNSTWNRRHRAYMAKINSGSLKEIAEVFRSLFILKCRKTLSFGEKKLLELTENLLIKEISLSQGNKEKEVRQEIESCFVPLIKCQAQ